jgi:hypothetical protein
MEMEGAGQGQGQGQGQQGSMDMESMEGGNLIIRVKRRRDDAEVADTLCIVEDEESHQTQRRKLQPSSSSSAQQSLVAGMRQLGTGGDHSNNQSGSAPPATRVHSRVILTRIHTIEAQTELDSVTLQSAVDRKRKTASAAEKSDNESAVTVMSANNGGGRNNSILVTNSKKTMKLEASNNNFVLVDMSQVTRQPATSAIAPINKSSTTKIVDPATRKLEAAINVAYKSGDFNLVMQAINAGANINYRTSPATDGRNVLMCAAHHCNTRMVKQLLARGVDLLQVDEKGWNAMEYARRASVSNSKIESKIDIQQWIYRASVKQLEKQQPVLPTAEGAEFAASSSSDNSDEYVYDIYCAIPAEGQAGAGDCEEVSVESSVPVVSIDGLMFGQNGHVELAFEYDSDWSDLADDEDIDSNDERFEGNDYPEDEDDENAMYGNGRDDDYDFNDDQNSDEDDDDVGGSRRSQQHRGNPPSGHGRNAKLPSFQNRGVGRVLKGGYIGGDGNGNGVVSKSKEFLQSLWGEENNGGHEDDANDDNSDGEGQSAAFRSRVANMRARTGMDFASNVHEFDESGLAKYGAELEEDGDDMMVLEGTLMQPREKQHVARRAQAAQVGWGGGQQGAFDDDDHRLGQYGRDYNGYNDVAYDHELDCSDDNDDN